MNPNRTPSATYRLQLNAEQTFDAAARLVPYLDSLGVTDLYASPILQARTGSPHGYDVVDPTRISSDCGGDEAFQRLVQALDQRGMGLVLDVVPNHMAASDENPWWRDLLEHGPASRHAYTFDVDWGSGGGRIVLPLIAGEAEQRLQDLRLHHAPYGLAMSLDGQRFPLDPATYALALDGLLERRLASGPHAQALREAAGRVPPRATEGPAESARRQEIGEQVKDALRRLLEAEPAAAELLKGDAPVEPDRARTLLDAQAYRLVDWRRAPQEVNYRRFFDISHLAGVRVEEPSVFDLLHARTLRLIEQGHATGLRIDHVDGLLDPHAYLRRLAAALDARAPPPGAAAHVAHARHPPRPYLVVEKILVANERLPPEWPVHGATGYEAGARLDGLFVDANGLELVADVYAWFLGRRKDFREEVHGAKLQIIRELFPRTFADLAKNLHTLVGRWAPDRTPAVADMEEALTVIAASLPVYRTYIGADGVRPRDRAIIERTLQEAARRRPTLIATLALVRDVLLLELPRETTPTSAAERLAWIQKWQQATGPVMAKGYEDTALYRYLSLVSLAEVGDDPESGTVWLESFHRFNTERLDDIPHAMTATSTHDSKRSQDVRARLHVLSELPREWRRHLENWREWNAPRKISPNGAPVPGPDMEYLLYETLVGAWPVDPSGEATFADRVAAYTIKAAREAKVHTSWMAPQAAYEDALSQYARTLVQTPRGDPFRDDLDRLLGVVAYHGMLNSLAQTVLQCTMPGVPDLYQGQELLDLSLVDPDNRRPIDFARRVAALDEIDARAAGDLENLLADLMRNWRDGRIKLFAASRALRLRRALPELFAHGEYLPVKTHGRWGRHVVSFARQHGGAWALVAVPRSTVALSRGRPPLGRDVWGSTRLRLPAGAPASWRNVLTGEPVQASAEGARRGIDAADILEQFPVALLAAGV